MTQPSANVPPQDTMPRLLADIEAAIAVRNRAAADLEAAQVYLDQACGILESAFGALAHSLGRALTERDAMLFMQGVSAARGIWQCQCGNRQQSFALYAAHLRDAHGYNSTTAGES